MKLAFTTLGCPGWNLKEIVAKAIKYGYSGVDFRGCLGEMEIWKLPEFGADAATTRTMFADAGLAIPCLGSSAKMFSPADSRIKSMDEVRQYADVAHRLGASFVRIFGGGLGGESFEAALPVAAEFLVGAAEIARDAGVEVVVETHDDWVDTHWLMAAFETAKYPKGVNVLWDVNHPYRLAGEDPDDTWKRIGAFVKYTHWKDSLMDEKVKENGEIERKQTLTLPGEGTLPLARFHELLKDSGYDGWYTFEWELKWHPELPQPDVAFPCFVKVMKQIGAL